MPRQVIMCGRSAAQANGKDRSALLTNMYVAIATPDDTKLES